MTERDALEVECDFSKIALCGGNFSSAVMRPLASQEQVADIPVKLLRII